MRILLITSQFPPTPGGGGAYTHYLSTALCSLGASHGKCDVAVLTSGIGPPRVERLLQNLEVHRGGFTRDGKVPYYATVSYGLDLCRSFRPQVIHGQHYDGAYVTTQLKASFPRVVSCVTLHKSPSGAQVKGHQKSDPQMAAILSYLPLVDKLITTCLVYRREFLQIGVPTEKLALIWPGIDAEGLASVAAGQKLCAIKSLLTSGLNLTQYRHLILCPARLDPTKDLETFVRAAGLLSRNLGSSERIAYLIAGKSQKPSSQESSYQADLQAIAKREGLSDDLYFGSFDLAEMSAIYKLCSISVLPSVREALGLVLLESMALRVPVVVANSPGITDVVADDVNALAFPPRDHQKLSEQLARVLKSSELADRLRKVGVQTVLRRFSHARMADDHYGLYRSLMSK